nr:putative integron gene cassette protein [uncultured bacterium]
MRCNVAFGPSLTVSPASHLRQLIRPFGCACIFSLSLQRALHSCRVTLSWLRHRRSVRGLRTKFRKNIFVSRIAG